MTILTLAQRCAKRLLLTSPSSVVGSTDNNIILLQAMIELAAEEIRDSFEWPELQKEHTFTLATNTASYALPADYNSTVNESLWNRDQNWELIGPLSPQEWQLYKSGLISDIPRQRFRIKGWGTNQFFIDPTPSSSENGQTCAYEYMSRTCFRPKTWAASTSWTGMRYCSYNGYIFDRGGTGAATTGSDNAPTPSDLTDGSITWTLYSSSFETINHDNDECILDNKMIVDGAVWRFKRERGLDYEGLRRDAEAQIEISKVKLQGSETLSIQGGSGYPIIGFHNYPTDDYL